MARFPEVTADGISGVSGIKGSFQNQTGIPAQSFFVGSHRLEDRKVQYTTGDLLDVVGICIYPVIGARIERRPVLK